MADTLEDLKIILQNHEERLNKLEGSNAKSEKSKINSTNNNYSGLAGGIRMIIDNGFLKDPKSVNEIIAELKREGYHHSVAPVSKMLSVNFTKNQKRLNRIKEGKIYKYVVRK